MVREDLDKWPTRSRRYAAEDENLLRLAWMRRGKMGYTGKTRQKKGANSCEWLEQADAITMSRVEGLYGTGTDGEKCVTFSLILSCAPKIQA
jgi:hypothetical protein